MEDILRIENLTKVYPGVVALDHVGISFQKGEVHALMGENGAGKSTLIKMIAGAEKPSEGTIWVNGNLFTHITPQQSRENGIGVIYQEFNLIPTMSVMENIFIGEKLGNPYLIKRKLIREKALKLFGNFDLDIDVEQPVSELSASRQQIVEIVKALAKNAKILIMDEPSAAIAINEVERMFTLIDGLKKKGVTIIYISHRMDEVFRIADRVSVLRDGQLIQTRNMEGLTRKELVSLMVGRELKETYPLRKLCLQEVVLEVEKLTGNGNKQISFSMKKGEILGIAGLIGAGRTELAKLLYGAAKIEAGRIIVNDSPVQIKSPGDAIALGIGLIPEDRKTEGVFQEFSISFNVAIMNLKRFSRYSIISSKKVKDTAKKYIDLLRIKTPSKDQLTRNLSGGNQQKVVVAKTLAADSQIIIFDEPTRGIDVGAKQEIYKLMNSLTEQGRSIIMISSEMEELMGMSDRILVFYEGKLAGEVQKEKFEQEYILELASGL